MTNLFDSIFDKFKLLFCYIILSYLFPNRFALILILVFLRLIVHLAETYELYSLHSSSDRRKLIAYH
jgi:hypothetical protein